MAKLKAYMVLPYDDESGGAVRFATNNAAARREGARELDCEWGDIETCRRAPEFDQYAPGPVPAEVLIEQGWVYECHRSQCPNDVSHWTEERVFSTGGTPYCCESCMASDFAYQRRNAAAIVSLAEMIHTSYPECRITYTHVYGDRLMPRRDSSMCAYVDFKFPSGKYDARIVFGDGCVLLHADDVAAWNAYRDSQ